METLKLEIKSGDCKETEESKVGNDSIKYF